MRENLQIDFPGVSAFPQWGGRAAVRSAWLHRRRAAAWRVENSKRDAFEIRLVSLGRAQSDMGACPGYVLSFGWRKQSRFEVERHVISLIDFYLKRRGHLNAWTIFGLLILLQSRYTSTIPLLCTALSFI